MHVKNLTLADFRNYKNLDVDFNNGMNIIYGKNGQGKTNLLEAIYMCAFGRSHRGNRDADLVMIGESVFSLHLLLERRDIEVDFDITAGKVATGGAAAMGKRICVNGKPIRKISELVGNINIVMFSPEDMAIVKEGPSNRRRLIDMLMSQMKPTYFYNLQQYMKILAQRNSLLKEIKSNVGLLKTIDVWNEALAEMGGIICYERMRFLETLGQTAAKMHLQLSDNKEVLSLKYLPSLKFERGSSAHEIRELFKSVLERSVEREIIYQTTLYGPQRDEMEIRLNGEDIKLFGSQGQQRTAVLSLKFSEIELLKEQAGEYPILLLDDVMSELDAKRREYVLANTAAAQTFITCTDKKNFRLFSGKAAFYKVVNGRITS